jgi:uncharacterized membrane protein
LIPELLSSLKPIFEMISTSLEIVGVIIIIYGAIVTLGFLIRDEKKDRRQAGHSQHEVKLQFTTRLLTALEFFIAADIIKTISSPEPMSLLILGVTIAIRAVLTFLLHKEQKSQREGGNQQSKKEQG